MGDYAQSMCMACPNQGFLHLDTHESSCYIIWRQKLELEKTTVVGMMEWQDVKWGRKRGIKTKEESRSVPKMPLIVWK